MDGHCCGVSIDANFIILCSSVLISIEICKFRRKTKDFYNLTGYCLPMYSATKEFVAAFHCSLPFRKKTITLYYCSLVEIKLGNWTMHLLHSAQKYICSSVYRWQPCEYSKSCSNVPHSLWTLADLRQNFLGPHLSILYVS